jgi:hypothetical protein
MFRAFLMAGFEVTLNGRFWVTPEAQKADEPGLDPLHLFLAWVVF